MDDQDLSGETYNPADYARGAVGGYLSNDTETDSCGTWERSGHVGMVCLYSAQGAKNIQYHAIDGVDQGGEMVNGRITECLWLELNFHGAFELPDSDGEIRKQEGLFTARIEGRRLEPLIRRIRLGRQVTVHTSGKAAEDKPQVDSIEIRPFEPPET